MIYFFKRSGNVTLSAMAAMSVVGISMYILSNTVLDFKKKTITYKKSYDTQIALGSTLDYVKYGISRKFCFDSVLMQDSTCDLKHQSSIQRMLLSFDQVNYIKSQVSAGKTDLKLEDIEKLVLYEIKKSLKISSLNDKHPLFSILNNDNIKKIASGVEVTIKRDNSTNIPRYGSEVFISVRVQLVGDAISEELKDNFSLTATFSIYPREIGTFALLTSRDLRMDKNYDVTNEIGDVSLHQFNESEVDNLKKPGRGLIFLSPVFINQNIHLPGSGKYSPVTFAEKVVLGNGNVFKNGSLYSPESQGGKNARYWSNGNDGFGGFLRGIEVDGGLDKGLSVFGKVVAGDNANLNLMKQCINRTQTQVNNDLVKTATLNVKELTDYSTAKPNLKTLKYLLYLSVENNTKKGATPFSDQYLQLDTTYDLKTDKTSPLVISSLDMSAYSSSVDNIIFFKRNTKNTNSELLNSGLITASLQLLDQNLNEYGSAKSFDLTTLYNPKRDNYGSIQSTVDKSLEPTKTVFQMRDNYNKTKKTSADKAKVLKDITEYLDSFIKDRESFEVKTTSLGNEYFNNINSQVKTSDKKLIDLKAQLKKVTDDFSDKQSQIDNFKNNATPADELALKKLSNELELLKDQVQKKQTELVAFQDIEQKLKDKLNDAMNVKNNPAVLRFYIQPVISSTLKDYEYDKLQLNLEITNEFALVDKEGVPLKLSIGLKAYTGLVQKKLKTTESCQLLLFCSKSVDTSYVYPSGYLNFDNTSRQLVGPKNLSLSSKIYPSNENADEIVDYSELDQKCNEARNSQSNQSFGTASFDTDFSKSTRSSWNFAGNESSSIGNDTTVDKLIFNNLNSLSKNNSFRVQSIVGECVVESSAEIVVGMFACDKLKINERKTPLRIIGTFIVGKLEIHPEAIKSGIVWSTIYHPEAVYELRNLNILKPVYGSKFTCDSIGYGDQENPIWHPAPSMQALANRKSCNVISLREIADPFRWTTVDPDCGVPFGGSNTVCKNQIVKFIILENYRGVVSEKQ